MNSSFGWTDLIKLLKKPNPQGKKLPQGVFVKTVLNKLFMSKQMEVAGAVHRDVQQKAAHLSCIFGSL